VLKRSSRAGVEDRWHRPPRRGEHVPYPADQPGPGSWCLDPKHGTPGTLVTTTRHGTGKRWQARWVDHDGIERSRSFDRKGHAQAHVARVTGELTTGTYVDSRKSAVPFGPVAEEWFAARRPKLKPSTAGGYRSMLDITVLPRWGDVKLSDITHGDVQQWVTWLCTDPDARQARTPVATKRKRSPLSAARAIKAHRMLKQVLAYAIRTNRLAVNPADAVELPRVVVREETALTHGQVRDLVDAAGDDGPMMLTLAYTGLRYGECAALRVGDVDLAKRRILVSKGIAQVTGQGLVEDTTKTHQTRSVPILTGELLTTLGEVTRDRRPNEYLFPAPDGGPMRNSYFRWRFDKACETAGLTGISPKTLRHTAGSLALGSGASIVTTSKLLGHHNVTTTMNVYSHMLPDDFDSLAARMDAAVRGTARSTE
jgi:integrase